ncbi:MAG: OadG family protein [Treponema sp.]|nr:OadG family protein [Treponema sp.]
MDRGMTIADMLGQSGVLSLLGMGVVFGFLVILVIAVAVTGKIIQSLGDKNAGSPKPSAGTGGAARTTAVAAAISAAVAEYRKTGN